MSGELRTSDHLLPRLRLRAATSRIAGSNVSLHPDQVIALVECAEALDAVILSREFHGDELVERIAASLNKLEAL